jgi:hypothetical protein
MLPYSDLALDLSFLVVPHDTKTIESIFCRYFHNVQIKKKEELLYNNSTSDVFQIKASELKLGSLLKKSKMYSSVIYDSTIASLIISRDYFYIQATLGKDYIIPNNIISIFKDDTVAFTRIKGGSFSNNLSDNIISIESDEFEQHYIVSSNSKELATNYDVFDYSRKIINL